MMVIILSFVLGLACILAAALILLRTNRDIRKRLAEASVAIDRQPVPVGDAVYSAELAALQRTNENAQRVADALANDLRRERDEWQRKYEELHRSLVAVEPTPAVADGILLRLCDRRGRLRSEVHVHHGRQPDIPKQYVYAGVTYRFTRERAAGVLEFTEEATR